jgi:hypothetical protein
MAPAQLNGPVYRATASAPPAAVTAASPGAAGPGISTQPVPHRLASAFRSLTGFDVSGIRVHRGRSVTEQASAYQARAFTKGGEVFLPDEAGPLEDSETQALLAHELTHAVQQRILSTALPGEASPEGQDLEREASGVAEWYRSGGTPLTHLPVTLLLAGRAGTGQARAGAWPSSPAAGGFSLPGSAAVSSDAQRQPGDLPQANGAGGATLISQGDPADGALTLLAGQAGQDVIAGSDAPGTGPVADGPVAVTEGFAPLAAAVSEELSALLQYAGRLAEMCEERPVVLDDPITIDELAMKAYPRLRRLLRAELLVDRERAGLLTDFR